MAADLGRNIALTWGGVSIEGLRERGIAADGEPIDVTSDEDAGWQTLLATPGQKSVTVSISGVTKSGLLRDDWFANNRQKAVVITYPNGAIISGTFHMANYRDTGPYNDAITFEAELRSTGVMTYSPGT